MSDVPDLPGDDEDGPQLPPELAAMFEQLGLGGGEGPQLPPELGAMLEQLGLGGEGGLQLPPELGAMFEQLAGPGGLESLGKQAAAMFGGGAPGGFGFVGPAGDVEGPVDWSLATRVALQVAAEDDRQPTPEEVTRARDALQLAEHWLDASPLPAPPDAGRLVTGSRQEWVNVAVAAFRPLVDPVARASTAAMVDLARDQFDQLGGDDGLQLPSELAGLQGVLDQLSGGDAGELVRPLGAMLSGLQAGQVLGQLSRTLLGQYDLGIPTAPRSSAHVLAVNVAEAFEGWDLDPTEVAIVLALHEAAMRRLYHAVPWLEAHVQSLVARFASGTVVDAARLEEVTRELMSGVDPEDPEALEEAMGRASSFRLEPTADQRRILERLQGVVCLIGAWARHEVARVADERVPSLDRIAEVQRRRRATRGDGEDLLAALLGLDLKPEDETVGERFIVAVEDALGPEGLRQALEHPENLPDTTELADPAAWLLRMSDTDLPDDPASLFAGLGDAPHEGSAAERIADRDAAEDGSIGDTDIGDDTDTDTD
ncbi:MAG: zinc-dependent metalloprotease [Nitriliruptor sp.]|uniref:zinc-dependent metalloprotease n=1 Tax=Nitriliruptor sp. TaxID=2448056 RepID=UPI0034A017FB